MNAQVDRSPEGGDHEDGRHAKHESAVGNADAPENTPHDSHSGAQPMTDIVGLLPCPFCGDPAAAQHIRRRSWMCGCNSNECLVSAEAWGTSKDRAIAAWNTRAAYEVMARSDRQGVGASVPDQALAVPVEPEDRLDPTGFDPSRMAALEKIIRDTLWMAQRYADGRMTYAVALYNDAAEAAMRLGVVPVVGDLFARDGMFASAIEARSDATPKSGAAEGESAVPTADAQQEGE